MGLFDGLKAKMAAGAGAEQGLSMLANEIRSIVGEVGWMLKDGKEVDLRQNPEPNAPANAQNATKKFTYNFVNHQQTLVSLNLYSVWMSMTATDCVLFAYINGASVKTFRFADYIQLYNNQPGIINRERLVMEVRDMISAFGSLTIAPVVQRVVMAPQPAVTVFAPQPVVTGPPPQQVTMQPQTATVFAPQPVVMGPPQPIQQQPQQQPQQYPQQPQYQQQPPQQVTVNMPPPAAMAANCPFCGAGLPQGSGRCPGCGAQFQVSGQQSQIQTTTQSTTMQMPAMTVHTNMPPQSNIPNFCNRCGGPVDPTRRMCTKCGTMY